MCARGMERVCMCVSVSAGTCVCHGNRGHSVPRTKGTWFGPGRGSSSPGSWTDCVCVSGTVMFMSENGSAGGNTRTDQVNRQLSPHILQKLRQNPFLVPSPVLDDSQRRGPARAGAEAAPGRWTSLSVCSTNPWGPQRQWGPSALLCKIKAGCLARNWVWGQPRVH